MGAGGRGHAREQPRRRAGVAGPWDDRRAPTAPGRQNPGVTSAILDTKIHAPGRRPAMVPRPRLAALLDRGLASKMTLVSAPPGFGKSTLVADWLAGSGAGRRSAAWVSLDRGDDDPVTFWAYVAAALTAASPDLAETTRPLRDAADAPFASLLAPLVNALGSASGDTVLVLDDYHVIESPAIHDGVMFLLEHAPATFHLIVTTRSDPPLPLARLRARGELVEIRAADLRFTTEEAETFLNGTMGLTLSSGDVAALEGRTEGWIAALQLAALSVSGRRDAHRFIAEFAGDDRYIVDYLVAEVLHRQPDDMRDFLLETSILRRMTGATCDAVTGRRDGRAVLETLERGNLFVVPLDAQRRWYRYHHLFADVLQAHLQDERPERVAGLHGRASAWFEGEGDLQEAIRHAFASGDHARAAELLERAVPSLRQARQETLMRRWFEALPPELFADRPVLSIEYVGALMAIGDVAGVERPLQIAERWIDRPGPDMVVVDEREFRRLPAQVAMYRAALARIHGDNPGTMLHARRVFDLAAEDDHLGRGAGAALLGLANWSAGDLDEASRWYAEAIASLGRAGHRSDVLGCTLAAADIRRAQGRLGDALRLLRNGADTAGVPDGPPARGAVDMHIGMAEILLEQGDVGSAADHLQRARDMGEEHGLPQSPYRSRVVAARLAQIDGDLDGASALLAEAARVFNSDFSPDIRPIASQMARIRIAQGRLDDAWAWARDRGLTAVDELDYLHESEHLTLARLLVAQGVRDDDPTSLDQALGLTERLHAAAEDGGRSGAVIEALVVGALARVARGDRDGAVDAVRRAAALAEPDGHVRVFLDEGPQMTSLLRLAATGRAAPRFTQRLLAGARATPPPPVGTSVLVEPLSERELDVLRLLRSDLDGPDIARELVVSLNTLRTHTKNIYAKLGVSSRRAAVRRAEELDLLPR